MAAITRATQKIFAGSASNIGVFGSAEAGTFVLSTSLSTLQGLTAYVDGWSDAVISGQRLPCLEEMNALHYIETTQLAYLFQEGIAEWDAGTTYYKTSIVKSTTTAQLYVSLTDNNLNNAVSSATNWQAISGRIALQANTTFYVATTGNDSTGTGLVVGSPWLTIQHAINVISAGYDLNGFIATIQVADGTYTAGAYISTPFIGGSVQLLGNATTPANCIISTTGTAAITASNGSAVSISGFKVTTTTSGDGVSADLNSTVNINGNMNFGTISGGSSAHISAFRGGNVNISANYTISGAAAYHYYAAYMGHIYIPGGTVTVSGTPAFIGSFANAIDMSLIFAAPVTYSGAATGTRYNATVNSAIYTAGGGASYFPGNAVGTTATGGQYV